MEAQKAFERAVAVQKLAGAFLAAVGVGLLVYWMAATALPAFGATLLSIGAYLCCESKSKA